MHVEGLSHIDGAPHQSATTLFELDSALPLAQGVTGESKDLVSLGDDLRIALPFRLPQASLRDRIRLPMPPFVPAELREVIEHVRVFAALLLAGKVCHGRFQAAVGLV